MIPERVPNDEKIDKKIFEKKFLKNIFKKKKIWKKNFVGKKFIRFNFGYLFFCFEHLHFRKTFLAITPVTFAFAFWFNCLVVLINDFGINYKMIFSLFFYYYYIHTYFNIAYDKIMPPKMGNRTEIPLEKFYR